MIAARALASIAGGAALVLAALQTYRLAGADLALSNERRGRETDRADAATAAGAASETYRLKERAWNRATQEAIDAAETESARDRAHAAAADRAAVGLRDAARAAAARCRAPAGDPGAAAGGPAASDPAVVLTDVLGRMEARGRELAALADERGIAGRACERAGDALRADPIPSNPEG